MSHKCIHYSIKLVFIRLRTMDQFVCAAFCTSSFLLILLENGLMCYQLWYYKYWPGFFISTEILNGWGQGPKWAYITSPVLLSFMSAVFIGCIFYFKAVHFPFLLCSFCSNIVPSLYEIFKWSDVLLGKYD